MWARSAKKPKIETKKSRRRLPAMSKDQKVHSIKYHGLKMTFFRCWHREFNAEVRNAQKRFVEKKNNNKTGRRDRCSLWNKNRRKFHFEIVPKIG
jgi:hypothetical protein